MGFLGFKLTRERSTKTPEQQSNGVGPRALKPEQQSNGVGPRALKPEQIAAIQAMVTAGVAYREIAAEVGCGLATVAAYAKPNKPKDMLGEVGEFAELATKIETMQKVLKKLGGKFGTEDTFKDRFAEAFAQNFDKLAPGINAVLIGLAGSLNVPQGTLAALAGAQTPEQRATEDPPAHTEQSPQQEKAAMGLKERLALTALQAAAPEDVAGWLLSQTDPSMQQLATAICNSPDDQIPALLAQIAVANPGVAPILDYLRQNPAKLVAIVRALRVQSGQPLATAL